MKKQLMSILAAIGLCVGGCSAQTDSVKVLEPKTFIKQAQADSTAIILDVRTPDEYAEGHIEGALLLNFLDDKAFNDGLKKLDKKHTYYIYCRSGRRSHGACVKMSKQGFKTFDMEGGYLKWKKEV